MKPINVLSLFDGISCGRVALDRSNFAVNTYYASEIEKNAMTVSKSHYPDIVQLGDVRSIKVDNLPKIDLLIGGSPCTNFSFAGKRNGMVTEENVKIVTLQQYLKLKQEGFEFKGESYLFWEYVRILKEVKPKYFLLENVQMSKDWEQVISEALGVEPVFINSRVISAQDRKRLYWCNWKIEQPQDKNISFADIVEDGWYCGSMRGRRINAEGHRADYDKTIPIAQQIECRKDNKTNCCTTVSKDNVAVPIKRERQPITNTEWRYLTPIEYERLQTLPDNYTACINSAHTRRALCGLGWTVDIIVHILNELYKEVEGTYGNK